MNYLEIIVVPLSVLFLLQLGVSWLLLLSRSKRIESLEDDMLELDAELFGAKQYLPPMPLDQFSTSYRRLPGVDPGAGSRPSIVAQLKKLKNPKGLSVKIAELTDISEALSRRNNEHDKVIEAINDMNLSGYDPSMFCDEWDSFPPVKSYKQVREAVELLLDHNKLEMVTVAPKPTTKLVTKTKKKGKK